MLTRELLLSMYRDMVLVRRFEQTVEEYAKKGIVPGFIHLSVGQEACQVGIIRALRTSDYKFPDHRSHGIILLAGSNKEKVMAEIFAKKTGLCGGKGGSMHIADVSVRNYGNNAIQGSIMATCLGTAFASQYYGTDDITAVFFGDGTLGRGECHESFNLAALWKLPILYVLVNNQYAISTRYNEAHPQEPLARIAEGYGIPYCTIDGNDVEKVYETTCELVADIRAGKGPALLELITYRWQGHFAGDPASYRPKEEERYWKEEKCPIKQARNKLLGMGVSEDQIRAEEEAVEKEIASMLEFALKSPDPEPQEALNFVYVGREVEIDEE
ncbi:thiamine pyrophosphate-dependent dehydrogenase E1 component subunit alpha [Moorellaceae bacterium AZ2]